MKICLIGDFSPNLDEGYKNTSHQLANELEKTDSVLRVNIKRLNRKFIRQMIYVEKPQIIHAVTKPSYQSLYFTGFFKFLSRKSKVVISALKPENFFSNDQKIGMQKLLVFPVRPDLVLVQTKTAEKQFRQIGCQAAFLGNGVNTNLFLPVSTWFKQELRLKYGIDNNRSVVLHVGHLENARNLITLEPLLLSGIQVVVAGSLYMGTNRELIDRLKAKGFTIFEGYQPNIEELYRLADCYVFPPDPGNSLSMPLSVLEAMSCNLPIVTRRFQGLEENFQEGKGFHFIDRSDDIVQAVKKVIVSEEVIQTRNMILPFSWQSVATNLRAYYTELLKT